MFSGYELIDSYGAITEFRSVIIISSKKNGNKNKNDRKDFEIFHIFSLFSIDLVLVLASGWTLLLLEVKYTQFLRLSKLL